MVPSYSQLRACARTRKTLGALCTISKSTMRSQFGTSSKEMFQHQNPAYNRTHLDFGCKNYLDKPLNTKIIIARCMVSAMDHNQGSQSNHNTKVLYDGECKICEIEISALKRFTGDKKSIDFVDITDPAYDPQNYSGVTYETAMKEMHVIDPSGQVLTQGDAIRHMYRACGLGWVAAFTELPGIRQVCDKLYVWFAIYRLNKALNRCDDGSCSIKLKHLRKQYGKD